MLITSYTDVRGFSREFSKYFFEKIKVLKLVHVSLSPGVLIVLRSLGLVCEIDLEDLHLSMDGEMLIVQKLRQLRYDVTTSGT